MFGTITLSKPSPPQSSDDAFVDNDNNVSTLPTTMTTALETMGRHEKTIRDLKAKLATSNDEKERLKKGLHSTQGDWEEESRSCGIERIELRGKVQEAQQSEGHEKIERLERSFKAPRRG
jgi:predicted RNase H-like nuclease (RuvC/YqgF family)